MSTPTHLPPINMGDLGRIGYDAYAEAVHGVNVRGEALPAWDDLGYTVQTGWYAAAQAIATEVG